MRFSVLLVCAFLVYVGADYSQYKEFLEKQSNNQTFLRQYDAHLRFWTSRQTVPAVREAFPCEILDPLPPATSVNKLTPADIKVVAAFGDSITAGTGIDATTAIGLLIQWRGLSWSVGGDGTFEDVITIPNIIKKYNPDVKGFSVGTGGVNSRNAHLDVAVPGAESHEMREQAEALVERMKNEPGVDIENDWKIITLFIGGNDLCSYCEDNTMYAPTQYVENIRQALDFLYHHVPKALVNVVPVLNIAIVKELNQNFLCDTLHLFLCKCAAYPSNSEEEAKMKIAVEAYQEQLTGLIISGQFEKEDFTVMIQPFFTKTELPQKEGGGIDLTYFAPDCFHLSRSGHQSAATALWNNMFEFVGEKDDAWQPGEELNCPTKENRYFVTYQNSVSKKSFGETNNLDQSDENQPSSPSDTSISTTGLITGACMAALAAFAVVAMILYKRRDKQTEKHHLLEHEVNMSYTQI